MNALTIHSTNGFQMQGSASIAVGKARVVFERRGLIETVAVYVGNERRPRSIWTNVLPATIREALSLAEGLSGFVPVAADRGEYKDTVDIRSPACVEVAGRCIHPLHNHEE